MIRSRRRTLALTIAADGAVTARAPLYMPIAEIEAFICAKQRWIERKRSELLARQAVCEPIRLTDGFQLPYLGGSLTLRLADCRAAVLSGDTLTLPRDGTSDAFRSWLKAQAALEFPPRVEQIAHQMRLSIRSLRVSTAKTRWGSMTNRRDMRLNAALLLTPPSILDYVIIHELSHIPHPDHSAAFWALVAQACPDYVARRQWLHQHDSWAGQGRGAAPAPRKGIYPLDPGSRSR